MKLDRTLRKRIAAGESVSGVLLRIPNEELVEVAACSGVDFILLDCEHGADDAVAVRQHIAAAAIFGVETLVRIGSGDRSLVLRATDAGASGIVVPHVDDQAQAVEAVQWARYRPLGDRGFALYSRAAHYGTISASSHIRRTDEAMLLFAMIESPVAASRSSDILGVPGIDGYMIGTSDLNASTEPQDPTVEESIGRVTEAGRHLSSIRMDIVNSAEQAASAKADGARIVVYNTTALLVDMFSALP
ncbi:HpcH/HpaI aldolase family protein [Corynebacterium glyciniphilum]|uniref:HpcH/HpaI aldolase family protein n=1 Tax=Corynebacterium glyciniphilum TaxID=1404244 RepID=UPI003DA00789